MANHIKPVIAMQVVIQLLVKLLVTKAEMMVTLAQRFKLEKMLIPVMMVEFFMLLCLAQ